jgi:NADH-quinone oxidoreductase subunit M
MDIVNFTSWTETAAIPLLSVMTMVPFAALVIVLMLSSSVAALRVGFGASILMILLSFYLLSVFDADLTGVQLFEHVYVLGLNYSVGIDGVSILFLPLIAILTFLALIYTLTTRRKSDRIQIACILAYEAILIGAFSSMNAMQFWFWCVLELIPVVIITLRTGSGQNRRWVVALVMQHWGSGLLMVLAGFLLLGFGVMGSDEILTFDWIALKQSDAALEYSTLIFFLLFFGFAIRMHLFPFHGWLPLLAEQGSVASVGVFVMGLNLGLYAAIRFVVPLMPDAAEQWSGFVLVLGLIGIFYGALLALMQINVRRLLAFAVISQAGILIIGVFSFNTYALEGSILLSFTFGLAIAGMLFSVGMIYKRTHTAFITRLGGLFDNHIPIAILFVICALSTMVMPGTPGFDGIHLLIDGTIKQHGWLVSIAILFGNVLTAALLLRAFQLIFITAPKRFQGPYVFTQRVSTLPSPTNERLIAIIICSLVIGIGLHTSPWIHMIDQNIASVSELHTTSYDTLDSESLVESINPKDTQHE